MCFSLLNVPRRHMSLGIPYSNKDQPCNTKNDCDSCDTSTTETYFREEY